MKRIVLVVTIKQVVVLLMLFIKCSLRHLLVVLSHPLLMLILFKHSAQDSLRFPHLARIDKKSINGYVSK